MNNKVLMVGTRMDGQGGVASVIRTWKGTGLMDRWSVLYISTNGPGGPIRKIIYAICAWSRCAWLILLRRVKLIHVHTSSYISFWRKSPILALAIATRHPFIVSLHGGAFREFYAECGCIGQAWIRLVIRRANYFVVLTDTWKRWAEKIEPQSHILVIPNPAPELPVLCGDKSMRVGHTTTWPQTDPLLLFLGRVEPEKGIFVLLEALAIARNNGAPWRLACGGIGDLACARSRASELGLDDRTVAFLGWIDGAAKHALLHECDMLVIPSFTENMPVALLEAFAYRKPVVATSVGGIPDIVTNGTDGFLCEPGNPSALAAILVRALAKDTDLIAMGAAARAKAEACYAPDRVVAQLEAVYSRLLSSQSA